MVLLSNDGMSQVVAEFAVALALYNRFHPKFLSSMPEALERDCLRRTAQCLDMGNSFLRSRGVIWPDRVASNLTPQARWSGWSRAPLHEAATMLQGLGFNVPSIQHPENDLMTLSGGPSKVTKAWSSLTILRERELLAGRMADQLGSIAAYLQLATGQPSDSVLHAFQITGKKMHQFSRLLFS